MTSIQQGVSKQNALLKKNKNKKQHALENALIPPVFRLGPAFM